MKVLLSIVVLLAELPADGSLDERTRCVPSGFGVFEPPRTSCLEPTHRRWIQSAIATNRRALLAGGMLHSDAQLVVRFAWPLKAVGSAAECHGVHAFTSFVDHDPRPGFTLDYNCGDRTYDTATGYNHQGTDYYTAPFPWRWMDEGAVQVVAAAPGTIVERSDGNFDETCVPAGAPWNAVYVEHADGSVAWYGHLKDGSLTTKGIGQSVARGEYLGVVGSSGNSPGPHLHFELHDAQGNLIDPYAGPCNGTVRRSRWVKQRPYYDSGLNYLMIGDAPIVYPPCPGRAITNEASTISKDSIAYFTVFYRDQLSSQVSQYRILRPNGSVFLSWSHSGSQPHYPASYWWWDWYIGPGAPSGTWTFEVVYAGRTYTKTFEVS